MSKIQTPQGERLKIFRMENGFNKKSTFARHIKSTHSTISAIEDYGREISDTVLDLIHFAFPDVNIEWLRSGALPKLLTNAGHFQIVEKVEGSENLYSNGCIKCAEKDKKIESLRNELDTLRKDYIDCLKEVSALKRATSG